jgi:hypothetical protein
MAEVSRRAEVVARMRATGIQVDEENTPLHFGRSIKGRIGTYLTVWCGLCTNWLEVVSNTKRKAGSEARHRGWVWTRAYGWLCPGCLDKQISLSASEKEE